MTTKIKRIPTQIYIGAFQGEETAQKVEQMVTDQEFDSHHIICTNMAVATRDIAGKTHVRELGNPQAMEQAVSSAVLGGLLGSISRLMIGSSAEAKAAREVALRKANSTAAAAAQGDSDDKPKRKQRRTSTLVKAATKNIQGMDKDRLDRLGKALKPGSSAIVLMFDEALVTDKDYTEKMKNHQEGTDAIADIVMEKIEKYLAKGDDIAFHLLMENGEIKATRTVEGKNAIQVRDIIVGNDKLAIDEVTTDNDGRVAAEKYMATPDKVTQARALLTSSLVAYEVSVDDEEGFIYESGAVHDSDDKVVTAYEEAQITSNMIAYGNETTVTTTTTTTTTQ